MVRRSRLNRECIGHTALKGRVSIGHTVLLQACNAMQCNAMQCDAMRYDVRFCTDLEVELAGEGPEGR